MGNLRLFVALVVLCAVFGSICAQNRGSSRYVPAAEEYDGESTRAPRVAPARGSAVRRQRPTPAPEPSETEDPPRTYQPRQTPSREGTTGRRVASRVSSQQYSPPPPLEPHIPETPAAPLQVEDLPPSPPAAPEGRPQGKRRRAKKRKRPQGAIPPKPVEEPEKLNIEDTEKTIVPVPELLNVDPKGPQTFENNPDNVPPPNFVSPTEYKDNVYNRYTDGLDNSPQGDSGPSQYYPPQTGSNRLPIESAEEIQSSRRYPEPAAVTRDVPNRRFVPPSPAVDPPTRGSYVPVLQPVRANAEPSPRLPTNDFSKDRTSDNVRDRSSNHRSPQRTSSPIAVLDPSEIIRNSGASAPQNNIFRNDQQDEPNRGHSEVRLPQPEDLPVPGHNQPSFSAEEALNRFEEDVRPREEDTAREAPVPSNRLPNPRESQYDSPYPSFLDDNNDREPSRNTIPRRNEDNLPPPPPPQSRNTVPSRGSPRRGAEAPPKESTDSGRRQISRYEPPLQRTSSRYNQEGSEAPSRSSPPQPEAPTRSRSSSRNRQEADPEASGRTRGSSRYQPESSIDTPTRTRGTQPTDSNGQVSRSRNTQRYQSEPVDSDSRVTSRRQPTNEVVRQPANQVIRQPVPEHIEEDQPPQYYAPELEEGYDPNPVRNTMRARPQFEVRDAPQPYEEPLYNEPVDDERPPPSAYVPEYQDPRQQDRREPVNQRAPPTRAQQGPPASRQQNNRRDNADHRGVSREPQAPSRAPQRDTRPQPQYEAPRREPSPSRQPAPRQQQPRARQPEPSAAQSRPRSSSKFTCPEPYGFFGDPVQCDKYYECRNGTAFDNLCNDGLAFNENSAPKFLRCDALRDVDCSKRPELQEARPTANCPRRYGLYPHETDCTKFWNCVDGTATQVQCPPGLTYNDDRATCDWADLVQSSCKTEDLLGFTCPEPNSFDLQDGVYTSYPHPENCQLHFVCIKGSDGERRPRLLSCNEGLVYSTESSSCTRPENVPGCEDSFPAPKRKPSREPEEEEPKPRRTQQARRTRN